MGSSTGVGWVTGPSFVDDPRVLGAKNAVRGQGLRTMASLRLACKRESETLVRVALDSKNVSDCEPDDNSDSQAAGNNEELEDGPRFVNID